MGETYEEEETWVGVSYNLPKILIFIPLPTVCKLMCYHTGIGVVL